MGLTKGQRRFLKEQIEKDAVFRAAPEIATSPHEADFITRAHEKARAVHRPSWPDYLVDLDGQLVAVEVKGGNDWFSDNQRRTFDILDAYGDLPIFVWDAHFPKRLIPWRKARELPAGWRERKKILLAEESERQTRKARKKRRA